MRECRRIMHALSTGIAFFVIGAVVNWALGLAIPVPMQMFAAWHLSIGLWIGLGFSPTKSEGET